MSKWNLASPVRPESVGVDSGGIAELVQALEAAPFVEPHALVIARGGQVITRLGWAPFTPDQPRLLYSLSKSFTITALGLALADGLVNLDQPALDHFPEVADDAVPERMRRVTVRNLAAMASGHADGMWTLLRSTPPGDLFGQFWHMAPEAEPGSLFAYNQMATYCLAEIVHRRSGSRLLDYLRPRLFEPLGLTAPDWQQFEPGLDLGFTGLFTSTDAVAALGQLYLDGGVWQGRRLLEAEFVAAATRRQVATDTQPGQDDPDWRQGYGYQFWISRHGFRGDGAFGQYCLVLPDQDLVVALTSQTVAMQAVLELVWAHLLPAVDRSAASPARNGPPTEIPTSRPAPVAAPSQPPSALVFRSDQVRGQIQGGVEIDFTPPYPTTVEVDLTPTGGEVRLADHTADIRLAIRPGQWTLTPRGPATPIAVAAGATWDQAGACIDISFIETPHRLVLTCDRSAASGLAEWVTPPLLGDGLRDLGWRG